MMQASRVTVISAFGERCSSCGYCSSRPSPGGFDPLGEDGSFSMSMRVESLSVYEYQALLDRGWRRAGNWVYKPNIALTCCPQYTIRMNVHNFQPSKAQRKLMRRLRRMEQESDLRPTPGGQRGSRSMTGKRGRPRSAAGAAEATGTRNATGSEADGEAGEARTSRKALAEALERLLQEALDRGLRAGQLPSGIAYPAVKVQEPSKRQRKRLGPQVEWVSASAHAVAAAVRRSGSSATPAVTAEKVAELFASGFNTAAAALEPQQHLAVAASGYVNLLRPPADADSGTAGVVQDDPGEGARACGQRQGWGKTESCGQAGREGEGSWAEGGGAWVEAREGPLLDQEMAKEPCLEVTLQPAAFCREAYELYCRYQMVHHNESASSCSELNYRSFLVNTPLLPVSKAQDPRAPSCGYGSFHMHYRLNGKLVAVGVVDLLPSCLSSKYLFWHPDHASLSLGRLAALREIQWVQTAALEAPDLQYYYLGFYIHQCARMQYKAEYGPCDLLCPTSLQWVRLDRTVTAALDTAQRSRVLNMADIPTSTVCGTPCRSSSVDDACRHSNGRCPHCGPGAAAATANAVPLEPSLRVMVHGHLLPLEAGLRCVRSEKKAMVLEEMSKWANAVGPACCASMAYALR